MHFLMQLSYFWDYDMHTSKQGYTHAGTKQSHQGGVRKCNGRE